MDPANSQMQQQPPKEDPDVIKAKKDGEIKTAMAKLDIQIASDKAANDIKIDDDKAQAEIRRQGFKTVQQVEIEKAHNDIQMGFQREGHEAERGMTMDKHRRTLGLEREVAEMEALKNGGGNGAGGAEEPGESPLTQILNAMVASQAHTAELIAAGNRQVVAAITAPRTMTTPDGRVYTAQTESIN
jgi:hypothetical protein